MDQHVLDWLEDVTFLAPHKQDPTATTEDDYPPPLHHRLWDTSSESQNVTLDMDQHRAIARLKAEVLAHARSGKGVKPRPIRSKRTRARKALNGAKLEQRKGPLKLDIPPSIRLGAGSQLPPESVNQPSKTGPAHDLTAPSPDPESLVNDSSRPSQRSASDMVATPILDSHSSGNSPTIAQQRSGSRDGRWYRGRKGSSDSVVSGKRLSLDKHTPRPMVHV